MSALPSTPEAPTTDTRGRLLAAYAAKAAATRLPRTDVRVTKEEWMAVAQAHADAFDAAMLLAE